MSHDIAQWGLSSEATLTLQGFPELIPDLAQARQLPPLPPGYVPSVVEVLFDDVPYLRSVEGILTYTRDCLPDYQPASVEYRVDDEMAFFQIGQEVVLNRIEGLAQVQGRLVSWCL